MRYTKPLVYTMSDEELSSMIAADACSAYSCGQNCCCGGNHCPGNSGGSSSGGKK